MLRLKAVSFLARCHRVDVRRSFCTVLEEVIPNSDHKKLFFPMPDIMDAKEGKVKRWLIEEGESFKAGQAICELSVSGIALALEPDKGGIMVERLANEGQFVEVNKPIASYVLCKDAYVTYLENKHLEAADKHKLAEVMEMKEEQSATKPSPMVLMREIKHFIQEGHIDSTSEYAKKLQSMARHGDEELLDIFTASFDGISFNRDTFDVKFFVTNSRDLVQERSKQQQ